MEEIGVTEQLHAVPIAAKRLGVSAWTLRWWIQEGRVESHKLFGRRLISEDEIVRLIKMSKVPARSETLSRVKNLAGTTRDSAIAG